MASESYKTSRIIIGILTVVPHRGIPVRLSPRCSNFQPSQPSWLYFQLLLKLNLNCTPNAAVSDGVSPQLLRLVIFR